MKGLFTTLGMPLGAPSDEQMMWRVHTEGDAQSFSQLVERWQDNVRSLCARILGDAHRAEDLAQETFMRIYMTRARYQPLARFSTFIWRIAINLCTDELRRRKRRADVSVTMAPEDQDNLVNNVPARDNPPDASFVQQEEGDLVRQALAQLPGHYQTVLVLRHYQGLKFREIAEILEIPEGTVKSRMAEAMTQLAHLLSPRLEERRVPLKRATPINPPCRLEIL